MSASARIRQSLEPLAAALVGVGLLHLLVGFIFLKILPEVHQKAAAKTASKLVWCAPADFLFDKKVDVDSAAFRPAPKPLKIAELAVPKTATVMPSVPVPSVAAPPAVTERQELKPTPALGAAIPAPLRLPEKSLADVLQANRGLLPQSSSSGLVGLQAMLTINSAAPLVAPGVNVMPDLATPSKAVSSAPPAIPAAPVPPPAVIENPSSPVTTGPMIQGDQKEANKYITLSAILPPGKASAKPRENKRYLTLLDIANINANERAEVAEAGGADMGDVEKALQQAILKEWTAPSAQAVPPSQRRAIMEIVILRDGTIADASIKTASGSSLLNASIRRAADRLKKIPVTLPSNFPKERYELRVNFQIE